MSKLPNINTRRKLHVASEEGRWLTLYLEEINKFREVIPREEEARLARRARRGDKKAKDRLIRANLLFVVSVAKQYQNQGLSLVELINEGNIGLITAVPKFDETNGYKFISYAVWWIRQAILQALARQSRIVRLPLNRVSTIFRMNRTSSELEQKFGRKPSPEEIGQQLEMNEDDARLTSRINNSHLSLDKDFDADGEGNNLLDILKDEQTSSPDAGLISAELRREIDRALNTLTPKEITVLKLSFGIDEPKPLTLEEIGGIFSLTRERIRQIKEKAIRRLQHTKRSGNLRAFISK